MPYSLQQTPASCWERSDEPGWMCREHFEVSHHLNTGMRHKTKCYSWHPPVKLPFRTVFLNPAPSDSQHCTPSSIIWFNTLDSAHLLIIKPLMGWMKCVYEATQCCQSQQFSSLILHWAKACNSDFPSKCGDLEFAIWYQINQAQLGHRQ